MFSLCAIGRFRLGAFRKRLEAIERFSVREKRPGSPFLLPSAGLHSTAPLEREENQPHEAMRRIKEEAEVEAIFTAISKPWSVHRSYLEVDSCSMLGRLLLSP